ncbi:aminopeptidase N-like [Penaeus indicus]|uniref:aminopeptidase N-like n=1 Tax=Penaeus indicus TaxID=29960 RepID=UPI00300D8C18
MLLPQLRVQSLSDAMIFVRTLVNATESSSSVPEEDIRLPQSLRPLHYLIQLQPFINGNFSILGYLKVEVEVLDTTSNVILHMLDIVTKNDTVKVLTSGGVEQRQIGIKSQHYDPVRQFYVAQMEEEMMKGERYTLQMEFLGCLNDQLRGFYRSSYKDSNGEIKYLAVSMFQPTDARRAFPCFDEPALKATFEVHLARETWMTSLSNMPLAETRPVEGQSGWVWDCFHNSVPMSTSIVAFAILDFSYVSSTTDKGTLFRVWAQPSAIENAEYASEVGPQILAFYENYFNVPYSLPKMDVIAVPDFSVVAMENWGLITFNTLIPISSYSSVEQDDLWEHLTAAAQHDRKLPESLTVKTIMDTWTLQKGFPVVKVARSSDGTSADVSQEHFLLMKEENLSWTQALRWWVPLSYTSQGEANFDQTEARRLMEDAEERITITSLPPNDQWVIFNLQQTGYYRVNYDDHNWNLLIQQLNDDHEVIHVANRAQIIDDAMNLARAGQLSYTVALEVYAYLKNEKENTPSVAATNNYDYLRLMFSGTGAEAALEQYYSDSTLQDVTSASQIPPSFLEEGLRLLHQWMDTPENTNIFPPDLREVFICLAVGTSGEEEWNFVWNEYMKSNDALDKAILLRSLTCTKDGNILSRFLEMAISPDSGMRMDDIGIILQSVDENSKGQSIAWSFLKKHWNDIFPFKKQKRGELLWTMTITFKTQDALIDLEAFLQDSNTDLKEVTIRARQVVERTKTNVKWMETSFPEIVQFLENRGYSTNGNSA